MARRRSGLIWLLGLTGAACACAIISVWWLRATPTVPASSPLVSTAESVVIVTIDTLRADHVGAYGWSAARTPAIDRLAKTGIRFDTAFAPVPITLPSHASLMTGLYPPGHGARDNGMRLRDDVTTLASVLRAHGWAAGAFVAAFPLDRRFGLDRGFNCYGDRMPRDSSGRLLNERPARVVVDEALKWLSDIGHGRFFLWVHFFEPHAPYEPDERRGPAGWKLPPEVRYDDEIARVDEQVGRVVAALKARASSTLVIFAGDHGEAFGEHGEMGHSIFIYDTTLRVPLIIAGAGVPGDRATVPEPVSLVDVFPTVLELLRLPGRDVDGVSLVPLMRGRRLAARELYAESFAPLVEFGWSSLRAVRSGPLKYIAAPRPEMYDVQRDPRETRDLLRQGDHSAGTLAARVNRYSGPELGREQSDVVGRDTKSRLNALGYSAGSARDATPVTRPDPKDRRELAARIAQVTSGELSGAKARAALEAIIAEDPRNGQAHMRLGYDLLDGGDARRAEPHFRAAIAASVPSADPYLGLALCLMTTGRAIEAARALHEAARLEPGNAIVEANLGSLALETGKAQDAVAHLTAAISRDPDLLQARFDLIRALAHLGRREEVLAQVRELLGRLPIDSPERAKVERLQRALQR